MLKSVVLPAPLGPMIDEMPRSTAKSTPWSAVSPPNRFVTPRASKRAGTVADSTTQPRAVSQRRAPASMSELTLATARGEDPLRAEDHHEDEDDAEHHPLVLGGLELGREIGEAVAEDRDTRVLELVEPERESLQDLKIQHGHDGGPDDRPGNRAHPAQDDHGEDADRLEEGERLRVDENLLGREQNAHHAGERRAAGERHELHAHERHAHGPRGQLVLADGLPRPADARILEPAVDDDDRHHDEQGEEIEELAVRKAERRRR